MTRWKTPEPADMEQIYPHCRRQVDEPTWRRAVAAYDRDPGETPFHEYLARPAAGAAGLPPHLAELARLEHLLQKLEVHPPPATAAKGLGANPTLQLFPTTWANLAGVLTGATGPPPAPGEEQLLLWRDPTGDLRMRPATDADLLALKLVVEDMDLREVARTEGVTVAWLNRVLDRGAREGLILKPPSALRRDDARYPAHPGIDTGFREAGAFTLQWHVTHACDLHCRHCYDRSNRSELTRDQGLRVLDDLYGFCQAKHVPGQVTFTGGNPLLLPEFDTLYRAAVEQGFLVAILGNPVPRERIERVVAIEPPDFYQVSLEGLREHNDYIRGEGHFERTMEFLAVLRDLGVHSMVMLTLTRDNQDQVLPLAELLRDRVDTFHFNRLSPVGEGAGLPIPDPATYASFLAEYLEATGHNPILGRKDNLFNAVLAERGLELFGGCTGHGCGAAFNFLSVLPDGEAHACRKFPSPVGNVLRDGIAAVYDSSEAARYRSGNAACRGCRLAAVCGGCMASTSGFGRDPFTEQDPYCTAGPL